MQPLQFFAMSKSNYFKEVGNRNGEQQLKLCPILLYSPLMKEFSSSVISVENNDIESLMKCSIKMAFCKCTHKDRVSTLES